MRRIHESVSRVGARWLRFGVAGMDFDGGRHGAFAQSVSSGTIEGTVKDESTPSCPRDDHGDQSSAAGRQLVQVSDTQEP